MKTVNEMNEKELSEADVPWPKTPQELETYVSALVERKHDYGTCVYAMSMAAVAAYNYVAHKLGVTGFQASCADLDIIRRTRRLKHGFKIVNFENLLYPQYCDDEHFPSWRGMVEKNAKHLADEARKLLSAKDEHVHANVVAHWEWVASLAPATQLTER